MIGEEFSTLVASVDFKADTTTLPFLRVALCATQVTAPRSFIRDGISKMICKSDFDKLKQKKAFDDIMKAEQLMVAAWQTLEASGLPLEKTALPFGKFQIRLVLLLLAKELKGREGKEYKTLLAINEQFQADFAECCGSGPGPSATAKAKSAATMVKSLDQVNDPVQIVLAGNSHIQLGKHYILREDGDGKVWKLEEVGPTSAKFSHAPYFGSKEEKEIPHSELKKAKLWVKPGPCLIEESVRKALLPAASSTFIEEVARSKAQCALYDKFTQYLAWA